MVGQTKVGATAKVDGPWRLPSGWEWVPLSTICKDIVGGGTPKRSHAEFYGGEIVWITPSDLDIGNPTQEVTTSRTTITELGLASSSAKLVPAGTVLFSSRATIGKISIAGVRLCTNQGFVNFVCGEQLNNRYLAWCLYILTGEIEKLAGSTTYKEVSRGNLRSFTIPLPHPSDIAHSLTTQSRIVARIESLLIEVKESRKLLDKMQQDASRVMESAMEEIFSNSNFDNLEREVIGKIADVKGGKRLPKGNSFAQICTPWPYLRVIDFKNSSIDITNLMYISDNVHRQIARYTISKDDVYISIAGTIGLVGTIPESLDGANLTENAARLVIKANWKKRIDKNYLVYFLLSPEGKAQIQKRSYAAGQPKLALMRIKTIQISFPKDIKLQYKIVNYLDALKNEVENFQKILNRDRNYLNQLEQSILERAYRGEI